MLAALGVIQVASIAAFVLLIRQAMDQFIYTLGVSDMWPTIFKISGVSLILAMTRGAEFYATEALGYETVRVLRNRLYEHLTGISPRTVLRSSRGALLLRFTGDLSTLRTWISRGLSRGIVSSLTILGVVVLLFVMNIRIGLTVVGVLLLSTSLSLLPGDRVRRATRAVRWRRSLLTSNVSEHLGALATVQAFGRTAGEISRFTRQNDDMTAALKRAARVRGLLRLISSAMGSGTVVAVIAVGAHEIPSGRATVGLIAAAISATRFISGPMRTLGRSHEYWQAAQVSRRKIMDFLTRPSRASDGDQELDRLKVRRGAIFLRGVSVEGALQEIDLTVPGGQLLAILGPNGAGKSTLLNVIARFVEPESGEVLIDSQNVAECSRRSLYRNLGMVSPDLPAMRGTLLRNITYRFPDAPRAEVDRVVLTCRLDETMSGRTEGLQMWLNEGATSLPVGHRQRVALARAMLGNPRILLLDEPTSNLDEATKEIFRRAITRYHGTVVLVTHDPVEASLADHVCIMGDGRIVEVLTGDEYRTRTRLARRAEAGRPVW